MAEDIFIAAIIQLGHDQQWLLPIPNKKLGTF